MNCNSSTKSSEIFSKVVNYCELDYLVTRDEVLHELFMYTLMSFSRCILIGIASAIDLAEWFLPRLQSTVSSYLS
ncbi:cell division control protein 6 homolog [Silene latifolia]|uniref:cell division control protein 6 homolog n=1 Tax=Silene latifolia TaxID=37657 RepID=UPI003D772AF1